MDVESDRVRKSEINEEVAEKKIHDVSKSFPEEFKVSITSFSSSSIQHNVNYGLLWSSIDDKAQYASGHECSAIDS